MIRLKGRFYVTGQVLGANFVYICKDLLILLYALLYNIDNIVFFYPRGKVGGKVIRIYFTM